MIRTLAASMLAGAAGTCYLAKVLTGIVVHGCCAAKIYGSFGHEDISCAPLQP